MSATSQCSLTGRVLKGHYNWMRHNFVGKINCHYKFDEAKAGRGKIVYHTGPSVQSSKYLATAAKNNPIRPEDRISNNMTNNAP